MHTIELKEQFAHLTEFMDKSLYQEAAPSMEEAIQSYLINGEEVTRAVILDIKNLLKRNLQEIELLNYVEQHSDYLEPEGAHATLVFIQSILEAGLEGNSVRRNL